MNAVPNPRAGQLWASRDHVLLVLSADPETAEVHFKRIHDGRQPESMFSPRAAISLPRSAFVRNCQPLTIPALNVA